MTIATKTAPAASFESVAGLPASAQPLQARVLTSVDEVEALAGEWNALVEKSATPHVFLTWEWIAAWKQAFRPDAQLLVIAVRSADERLAAIGPFYQCRLMLGRLVPYRCLRILGDAPGGSEYGDILARRDIEAAATMAVLESLLSRPGDWDAIWLPNMSPSDDTAGSTERLAGALGLKCRSRDVPFSRIVLPSSFAEYLNSLSGKMRYQVRHGMNRLERECGAVLLTCDSQAELEQALPELFDLHQARWTSSGMPGIFADAAMQTFYRLMAKAMLESGQLRLHRVQVGGRTLAAQLGLVVGDVLYELQRGFDPTFAKIRGGVGGALRAMVIRKCIEDGMRVYDFLGGYNSDKERAGAECCLGRDVLMTRPSLKNNLLFASRTWPTGRYLRFVH